MYKINLALYVGVFYNGFPMWMNICEPLMYEYSCKKDKCSIKLTYLVCVVHLGYFPFKMKVLIYNYQTIDN